MSLLFWALCVFSLLLLLQTIPIARSLQYKVGDLDSWGVPPPTKSSLYSNWSQNHHFNLGDSLLFLYPPSQDSVIQVTERAYKQCATSDPIWKMDDGNSVFNITAPGNYYFISGVKGHCEKGEKILIKVATKDGKFFPPVADSAAPVGAPSNPNVFGPMPMGLGSGSGSGSAGLRDLGAVGSLIGGLILWVLF